MRTISHDSSLSYGRKGARVRNLPPWSAVLTVVLLSALGCQATSLFTRKHYAKPTIESPAQALATLRESSDPVLRHEAFEYLGNPKHIGAETSNRDEITSILGLALSAEPQPETRILILQSIARIGSPHRWELIAAAVADKDAAVRVTACRLIGNSGNADAAKSLNDLVRSDTNLDVRLAAADALGNVPNRDSALALAGGLEDPDVAMRYRCRQSLRHILGKDHAGDVAQWREDIQTANFEELAGRKKYFGLTW